MSRQKQCFDYNEIADVWLRQGQDYGYTRSNRMFFEEDTIYSYGRHFAIAKIDKEHGVVLFTARNYSVTTSKHIWLVRAALRDSRYEDKIVYVKDPDYLNHKEHIDSMIELDDAGSDSAMNRKKAYLIKSDLSGSLKTSIAEYIKVFPEAKKSIDQKKVDDAVEWKEYVKGEVAHKLIEAELLR